MIPSAENTLMNCVNQFPPNLDKAQLRRRLLETRQSISKEDWRDQSDRICDHLQASSLFQNADVILAYMSFRQEPDLSRLVAESHRTGTKVWGFPRCVGKSLVWHRWQPGELLQTGELGIWEPHPDLPTIAPSQVNLILVPAVACDQRGYRLGYGGGFYDRMLSLSEWQSIPTLGIVFEFAYFQELPVDHWDQPLSGVCTEAGLQLSPE